MRLRNKKTGEIVDDVQYRNYSLSDGFGFRMNGKEWEYHSLAELNEDWEDYEEDKYYYTISAHGVIHAMDVDSYIDKFYKEIGNYFETKEQAEKAIEKLKAWKLLRNKGIKVIDRGWEKINNINREDDGVIYIKVLFDTKTYDDSWDDDLDLLFGGEE